MLWNAKGPNNPSNVVLTGTNGVCETWDFVVDFGSYITQNRKGIPTTRSATTGTDLTVTNMTGFSVELWGYCQGTTGSRIEVVTQLTT